MADNPYRSPEVDSPPPPRRPPKTYPAWLAVVIAAAIIAVLYALSLTIVDVPPPNLG